MSGHIMGVCSSLSRAAYGDECMYLVILMTSICPDV